ncbi:MAG: response regulator transcription factor [Bacteroidota bacterium]
MLNCVIIDDESFAIDVLTIHIDNTPKLNLLYSSTNPINGYNYIIANSEKIDIVFLDIQMKNMTGIELIKLIPNHIKTVFTTAHDQFALTAFDVGANDYLMKPISYEKFIQSINKIGATKQSLPQHEYFFIHVDKKLVKINIADVIHVEGMGNFLGITCKHKPIYICTNTFNEIEKYLTEPNFVRINKSHIIAFSSISSVEGNDVRVVIQKIDKNQEKILPIGITYKKHFLSLINKI